MATRDIEEGELIVSEEPALVLGPTEKRGVSIGDNVCCVSEQAYMKMQITRVFMSGRTLKSIQCFLVIPVVTLINRSKNA